MSDRPGETGPSKLQEDDEADDSWDYCWHVPPRFHYARTLDVIDTTVGGHAIALRTLVERIVAGDVKSALICGPVGSGKSLAAAVACHLQARPLMKKLDAASRLLDDITARLKATDKRAAHEEWVKLSKARDRASERYDGAGTTLDQECPDWLAVPQLLHRLRREMGTEKRTGLALVEGAMEMRGLLVLDDLGVTRTEWSAQTITELVGERYDREMPTLATSNLTPTELAASGLERVVSRLAEDGALITIAAASDYRMKLRRTIA